MVRRVWSRGGLLAALLVVVTLAGNAYGFVPKAPRFDLDRKEFFKPDMRLSSDNVPLEQVKSQLGNGAAWARFFAENGKDVQVWIDPRSGAATNIMAHVALIPGRGVGNDVTLAKLSASLGRSVTAVTPEIVAESVRRFVVKNADVFAVDAKQLGRIKAERVNDEIWQISIRQELNGIPVRWGQLAGVINNGNLVIVGTENWGNAQIDTTPKITVEAALKAGWDYVNGDLLRDKIIAMPALEIIPFAPPAFQNGETFAGPAGAGYGHRLAYTWTFRRAGERGTWQVSVDATNGEVLELKDTNQYAKKKVTGGVYPLTNTDICPDLERCGTMQLDQPMPFANTGLPAPANYANSAGMFDWSSGTVTTTLTGPYVKISDTCGALSESSTTGDLLMGGVPGTHDCTTAGSSAGDTPSSRSAFYELNKLIEQARGWLPNNTWLQAQLPANVNLNSTCNAFYDYTSVNFYKSGGGCRNTGEEAAVFDHEWGHGLDDNDTNGSMSVTSESYADIAAIYRLQMSCVGYGFFWTSDNGCGQVADGSGYNNDESQSSTHLCDTDCSGVRCADYDKIQDHQPHTPANFSCVYCNSGGSGPCGREVHCDARPATESAWDFAARDLQAAPFGFDKTTAFMIANKVFFQGSGNIGNWHTCSCPSTSGGCASTNAYMSWLAADDDNGNVNDGTPHMTALYNAFNRHGIACATPTAVNSGCSGAPTAAPVRTAHAGSNQVMLSWTAVPGATKYWVLRSEGFAGCDFGKALIATVVGTSYTDPDTSNGRTYSYNVVAVGNSDACFGAASTCTQATPQPCAGSVSLDRTIYNCQDTVNINLVDSDLTGAGTQAVSVSSNTEAAPETIVLTETPAGSGVFTGSIPTTGGPVVAGDHVLSVSNGDTISVQYVDVSYCGDPNVPVTATAPVDCAAPVISNVFADGITGSQAAIHWTTDEASDSTVHYGRSLPLSQSKSSATLTTSHNVALSQLAECSTYYYTVESKDPASNVAVSDNGGALYTFKTSKNVNPSYVSTDTPVAIPDNTATGASSVIAVADTNTVLDVNVTVNITHTYDGDITLYLIGPNGTQVTLSQKHGSSGDNYVNTVFDDSATTAIASGSPPFTGTFTPDTPLSVLNGIVATGNWTLKVVDNAGSDVGTIDNWTLTLLYPAEDCGATLRLDADTYSCTSAAGISVKDSTLAGQPSLTVTVQSNTETTPEVVTLLAQPAPHEDTFTGSVQLTGGAPVHGDGVVSVADGDTLTVTYVDADDGQGNTNVVHTDTATTDCVKPAISSVASTPGSTKVNVTWATNENATSVVHYGPTVPPGLTASVGAFVTAHDVPLSGLSECTQYYYSVESVDAVGNVAIDDNHGQYYTFTTLRSQTPSYTSTDTPVAIPDNSPAGAISTINVTEANLVQKVTVTVNITHTFDGDLTLSLIAPNGTTVALSNRHGSSSDNYTGTIFDDDATTPIASGTPPYTGSFKPDSPLSVLNGIPANGAWQLKVVDSAGSDTGSITSWTLNLTYAAGTCGASAAYQSNTRTDSCVAGGTGSGDGVVDRGEDVASTITIRNSGTITLTNVSATLTTTTPGVTVTRSTATYPDIAAGANAPSNAPGFAYAVGPTVPCGSDIAFALSIRTTQGTFTDSFTVRVGSPGVATTSYPSTDVPKPIPDNNTTGVTSVVPVTATGTVQKIRVTVNITHTWDGDITLYLIGPNGTSVTLSNRHGSSGDNYTNTVFDDAATTPIASGNPPYTGSFKPDSPLSALNGIPSNGNWTLKVTDSASSDTGTITGWTLELTADSGIQCHDCGAAIPSFEPVTQAWVGKTAQQWEAIAGATFYNLYRGTAAGLPDLVTANPDSCLRLSTTSTATGAVLTENPLAGSVYWYLVRAANPVGEGPAGDATSGPRSQQSTGSCP